MSEKAKASGQNVPKFRFQSEAEHIQKSKLRMEKSGEELERAREKLEKFLDEIEYGTMD